LADISFTPLSATSSGSPAIMSLIERRTGGQEWCAQNAGRIAHLPCNSGMTNRANPKLMRIGNFLAVR
ncbi:MAG TPA: hypothetical protein VGW37_10595, partial [Terriglobia bacterium]|nr:hypothetical protein [Terriglobia bacterium]